MASGAAELGAMTPQDLLELETDELTDLLSCLQLIPRRKLHKALQSLPGADSPQPVLCARAVPLVPNSPDFSSTMLVTSAPGLASAMPPSAAQTEAIRRSAQMQDEIRRARAAAEQAQLAAVFQQQQELQWRQQKQQPAPGGLTDCVALRGGNREPRMTCDHDGSGGVAARTGQGRHLGRDFSQIPLCDVLDNLGMAWDHDALLRARLDSLAACAAFAGDWTKIGISNACGLRLARAAISLLCDENIHGGCGLQEKNDTAAPSTGPRNAKARSPKLEAWAATCGSASPTTPAAGAGARDHSSQIVSNENIHGTASAATKSDGWTTVKSLKKVGGRSHPCSLKSRHKNESQNLMITNYKVERCPEREDHDWNSCDHMLVHGQGMVRRNPYTCWYKLEKCSDKKCTADDCSFAHNDLEVMYHPLLFRTSRCNNQRCDRGEFCSFAHSDGLLRRPDYALSDTKSPPKSECSSREVSRYAIHCIEYNMSSHTKTASQIRARCGTTYRSQPSR